MVKYRHCDGALVLKITDDKVVRHVPLRVPNEVAIGPAVN